MEHNEGGVNVSWDVGIGEVIIRHPAYLVGSRVPRDCGRAGRASLPGFAISSGESEMATVKAAGMKVCANVRQISAQNAANRVPNNAQNKTQPHMLRPQLWQ